MSARPLSELEDKPSKAGRPRVLIGLALAANLAACPAQAVTADASGEEAPPNMRAIIAANLQRPDPDPTVPAAYSGAVPGEMTIFPAARHVSDVEISDAARRTLTMLRGWTWQTCLRATVGGKRITLAVFVARNRVVDARTALIADRCDEGNYAPLPVKRPQPRPSTKGTKGKKPAKTPAGEKKKP
jgi:hypothetical protein